MQGTVSFHPVDLRFFDELIQPLVAGGKVNPEEYLERALRLHNTSWRCDLYIQRLEELIDQLHPPPPPAGSRLLDRVKARLERFDYRPDPRSVLAAQAVEPELHLHGRPFFITEGSADRVASLVDEYRGAGNEQSADDLALEQLVRLEPKLGNGFELDEAARPAADLSFRRDLLSSLKTVFDLSQAAAQGDSWGPIGAPRRPALEVLPSVLPWHSVLVYSRTVPFWFGHDVDGLETVCRAAGVEIPDLLVPAYRLFGEACDQFPQLRESLHTELHEQRDVGAFVAPADVPSLLDFLNREGSRIIRAATHAGEGETCTVLLRKVRECLRYAQNHGMGYLEAAGIPTLADTEIVR